MDLTNAANETNKNLNSRRRKRKCCDIVKMAFKTAHGFKLLKKKQTEKILLK